MRPHPRECLGTKDPGPSSRAFRTAMPHADHSMRSVVSDPNLQGLASDCQCPSEPLLVPRSGAGATEKAVAPVACDCDDRRMCALDHIVEGSIPALQQPSSMTCWATVSTMLLSWKDQNTYPIVEVMNRAGVKWRDKFTRNQGLSGAEKNDFLQVVGLRGEPPATIAPEGFSHLLRRHGALWVTTDEHAAPEQFSVHARVLSGIVGDGTPAGTQMLLTDPADGRFSHETYGNLILKFEALGRLPLRIQIVHF